MSIRTLLVVATLTMSLTLAGTARAQSSPSTSGDTKVNDSTAVTPAPEGVYRLNGAIYLVAGGRSLRLELREGEMVTLDGLVHRIPQNFTLPTGRQTSQGAAGLPAGQPNTAIPGTADRDKIIANPTPGATTPSVK